MAEKETAGIGKGTPGPGRPAGVPNRTTTEVREAFRHLVEDNADNMQAWLAAVAKDDPAKALDLMAKLAEYVVPRLSRSELRGEGSALTVRIVHQGGPPPEATP